MSEKIDLKELKELTKDDASFEKLQSLFNDLQESNQKLRQQEQYLRNVLDLDPSFIFARDKEGVFKLANQALADSYGISPEELVGKDDSHFIEDPNEIEHILSDDREVLDTWEEKIIPERKITDINGRERWFRIVKRPLISETGEVEEVLAIGLDITDVKQAQLRHKLLEKRYQTLLDAKMDVFWLTDADGTMSRPNQNWLNHTGLKEDEAKGLGWINAVHVDDRDRFIRKWKQSIEMGTRFEYEAKLRNNEFEYQLAEFIAAPVSPAHTDEIVEWGRCRIAHQDRLTAGNHPARLPCGFQPLMINGEGISP